MDYISKIEGHPLKAVALTESPRLENSTPYLFRPSYANGYGYETLIGGTCGVNQLVQNGNFADSSHWYVNNGSMSVSGNVCRVTCTSSGSLELYPNSIATLANHKYLVMVDVAVSANNVLLSTVYTGNEPRSSSTSFAKMTLISYRASDLPYANYPRLIMQNASVGDYFDVKNFNVIDLTAMLGSTIADYIYTLESGTAGAGIAWLKSHGYFTKPYYPYDTGSLLSVKALKHITVGFNQWDEETELGSIDGNGNLVADNDKLRSKNYTPVIGGVTYYFNIPFVYAVHFYNGTTWLGYEYKSSKSTITIPANADNIKFRLSNDYGTTYNHDICINISDNARNGTYEPYISHEYDLSGDRNVNRFFGIVDLGSLTWVPELNSGHYHFYSSIISGGKKNPDYNAPANLVCGKLPNIARNILYQGNEGVAFDNDPRAYVYLSAYDNASATGDDVKTALDGVYLVYELATPTTETVSNPELRGVLKLDENNNLYYFGDTCTDFTNPQVCEEGGTEEYVDGRTVEMPVGHSTFYLEDLKTKLENAPDNPTADGDYIVRRNGGTNEYFALPTIPNTDGTYSLKCTVSSGTPSLSWVADE